MEQNKQRSLYRVFILAAGVFSMLFAGIIYAWSILKAPLGEEFHFNASALALNFTLTMAFFCIGGFLGSQLQKKIGVKLSTAISGLLAAAGFIIFSLFANGGIALLYIAYAGMAGLGIGIAYNVIISTVNAWFPDKKGLCSGCLMMGFGLSTLLLGNVADAMFKNDSIGWRKTYIILGIALGIVLLFAAVIIRRHKESDYLPAPKAKKLQKAEGFEIKDMSPLEMIKRFSFWRAFLSLVTLTAVGSSVISFARDMAISVGAKEALATTLVGVLAVCNGLGRIITGALFDSFGRRITMISANLVTVFAAGITLLAVSINSLPLCIVGLCLTGMSYGSSPTVSSAFTSSFYGQKHFATNFSIMNFNLFFASFIATACSAILTSSGGYTAPFILLLSLAAVSLGLTLSIRKP